MKEKTGIVLCFFIYFLNFYQKNLKNGIKKAKAEEKYLK